MGDTIVVVVVVVVIVDGDAATVCCRYSCQAPILHVVGQGFDDIGGPPEVLAQDHATGSNTPVSSRFF